MESGSPEVLEESIKQYEDQLAQVEAALSVSSGSDRDNLRSLQSNIKELINLTKENLRSVKEKLPVNPKKQTDNVDMDEEYALFKAEIEAVDQKTSQEGSNTVPEVDIQDDLDALEGMKCQAPHGHEWGQTSYHNAIICEVVEPDSNITTMQEIQVRVIFINPTHREMMPCPYFLEGNCRFSDSKCHFSHGEVVPLSLLKEYTDPDFTLVRDGVMVLAKHTDNLWHRAKVLTAKPDKCDVKFESSGIITEVKLHDILPLQNDENAAGFSDTGSSDSDSDAEQNLGTPVLNSDALLKISTSALGDWEKHTKGFGSKLMAKMGYITGMGLGKCSEGRVDPVEAVVLPPGKSLDHCMELKEKTGDKNLFKAERKLKMIQRRQEAKLKMQYERAKRQNSMFDLINATLGSQQASSVSNSSDKESAGKSSEKPESSSRQLNMHSFQVNEDIKRAEKDLVKLREALHRHKDNRVTQGKIKDKIDCKKRELDMLRDSEKRISKQQKSEKDRQKLAIF